MSEQFAPVADLVQRWQTIAGGQPWVLYAHGTAVMVEGPADVESAALRLEAVAAALHPTQDETLTVVALNQVPGWVVHGAAEDVRVYVPPEDVGADRSEAAVARAAIARRGADLRQREVLFVSPRRPA